MLLHELGHFLTARLLGLDAILITLGLGPKVWSGKIFGVPLRIHAWPLLGLTCLGSQSLRLLRLRVWISVLMGPATNVLLIATRVGPSGRRDPYSNCASRLLNRRAISPASQSAAWAATNSSPTKTPRLRVISSCMGCNGKSLTTNASNPAPIYSPP